MLLLAQTTSQAVSTEQYVGTLAALALVIGCVAVLLYRFFKAPVTPDPWNDEVAAEVERDDARPLCSSCLTPHGECDHFCSNCGAPVGPYTNLLPFPQILSIGHMLRIGTAGKFKRSKLTVIGFALVAVAEYAIFAPVYWMMLQKNVSRLRETSPNPAVDAESKSSA